tara:strand:- start:1468 stop:2922 length:1455 start_codon:yes stop_codon:yes gene_type:complete
MAVFYKSEKAKLGTVTGTILHFPRQLAEDQDPSTGLSGDLLPAGYLRCDGRILSAALYPALALILGVGTNSKFKKDEIALTDDQFQLPDFRMKTIRHTNSSDVGRYNDIYGVEDDGDKIFKSGVGLEVVQRAPSPWQVQFTGDFFLPSQTLDLQSSPQFSRSNGNAVAAGDVQYTEIQPHMHFSTTRRFRQDHIGSDTAQIQFKSHTTRSSLEICQWFAHSRQELCYFAADSRNVQAPNWDNNWRGAWFWGGGCKSCGVFKTEGQCLWPVCHGVSTGNFTADGGCQAGVKWSTTGGPGDTDDAGNPGQGPDASYNGTGRWLYHSGNWGQCDNGGGVKSPYYGGEQTCFGEVVYDGKWFQQCRPSTLIGIGSPSGQYSQETRPMSPNYTYPTVPYSFPGYYASIQEGISAGMNLTTRLGTFGNLATHSHIVPFEVEPHTYQIVTDAVNITAYGTLESTINIQINKDKKADEFIQPFVITEYIIKT